MNKYIVTLPSKHKKIITQIELDYFLNVLKKENIEMYDDLIPHIEAIQSSLGDIDNKQKIPELALYISETEKLLFCINEYKFNKQIEDLLK